MDGKRVVIIGGTSGLGFATAEAVTARGASVVVAARNKDRLDNAVAGLPAGTEGHTVDVTDEGAVRELFERIGAFDHLAYTAGEPLMNSALADTDIDAVRAFFGIRYFGALSALKYAAPYMRPGGSAVLTSGTASTHPLPGTTAPSSVLAAIEGLARAAAVDLAPVRVNAVVPGIVRTEMWNGLPEEARRAMWDALAARQLVGPRIGEAADVAEAIVFLMNSRHTTGASITIDGGFTLG